MTEDEAKEKRCCVPGCGEVLMQNGIPVNYCIGSECMAWRWADSDDGWTHRKPSGEMFCADTLGKLAEAEINLYSKRGYCGRTGAP